MTRRRRLGWAGRLGLAGLSLGVSLAVLEGGFRLLGPRPLQPLSIYTTDAQLGYRLRPGARAAGPRGESLVIGAGGLRGKEQLAVDGSREASRVPPERVLFLGDSFVFGLGVEEEETLPAALERSLRAAGCAGVRVGNGGVPGYNLHQVREALSRALERTRPDLLIVGILENDLHNPDAPDYVATSTGGLAPHPRAWRPGGTVNPLAALDGPWLWLQLNSVAFREISWWGMRQQLAVDGDEALRAMARRAEASSGLADRLMRGESDYETEPRFAAAASAIGTLAEAAEGAGVRLELVILPRPEQVVSRVLRGGSERLCAIARAEGVSCLDLAIDLEELPDPLTLYLFPGDHHPSARGHAAMAAVLSEHLQDLCAS